ncbi:MAG TPA: LptE family protein [Bryobacteraceae bacterium]|nr:LptE family protein [Bryobacteraceae bacterium]
MKGGRPLLYFALCLLPFTFASCGYHVAGTTDVLPKKIKTIAIPAFGNITTRYKISDLLAAAITREFISRTRYQIVSDSDQADAVLKGSVVNFVSYPTVFDPKTGRAAGIQAIVTMQLTLRDRATNAVLFDRPHMESRQNYEISVAPRAYFDESEVGMDRLSRDVARAVVSAVLENF